MVRRILAASAMLACGAASADELYTVNPNSGMLVRFDTDTLNFEDVGPLGVGFDFGGLAWDGDTMYMVQGFAGDGLYTVDLDTGAASLVGSHGFTQMFGLEYDPTTDKLYGGLSTTLFGFYELDRDDGSATFIGNAGIGLDGLSYDSTRDILVGAFAGPGDLYDMDRDTGAAELLNDGEFFNNCGMTYVPSLDEHWMVDWSGFLFSIDPADNYSRETILSGLNSHDGLANVTAASGCQADCNGDGDLNILDFVCFQGEWQAQTPAGDCNGDGLYNILDFVCFQGEFQKGCP